MLNYQEAKLSINKSYRIAFPYSNELNSIFPDSLHPTPYSLHPTPYSLLPTPYSLCYL
ncbi:MAG: hypothetical protein F6K50_02380 [Moorea sp. SIO3I7]|uniref:hypothetical protein n=1 Tax=unclassified Moorena TaxID=2683338 RepID=UPI0013C70633|nr:MULTISPECIES: hypothetical protein [unclassified Moorena]NEN94412.1 hypothetical protein [Moorena sp. SIO3I7]NEO21540.1 hypothetical protein [Moorena sp. SIO4A5]NEQ58828.1 hypothetical protein [Moorena sp. SIO4A1]